MKNKSQRHKIFFFWADGMAETKLPNTSLALARTPNMDHLLSQGEVGFYQPFIMEGSSLPKTDIVIPYMYYISPEEFQGRAALELIDAGRAIKEGTWIGSFRVSRRGTSDLVRLPDNEAKDLLKDITGLGAAEVAPFPYSSHKNMFAIMDEDRSCVETHTKATDEYLKSLGMAMTQEELHQFKIPESPLKEKMCFIGWSRGSLRGTFRLVCSGVNEFTPKRYCFEEYREDFEHVIATQLEDVIERNDILVFFIKETDSASHAGNQVLKIKAIETIDWVIGAVRPYMPDESIVAVLADHPTDLKSPTAVNAPTPYILADISKPIVYSEDHFCEQFIMEKNGDHPPVPMIELREKIYNLAFNGNIHV